MSTMTDAFVAATGHDPSKLGVLILMLVSTVAIAATAYVVIKLWDAEQDGQLKGALAKQHAARALILLCVLLVVLL